MLKKVNKIKRTYYFQPIMLENLQQRANETGYSISDIIRMAIENYLKGGQ
jgi:hypothetical protein